jgi:PAS domain S-box-containing protein
VAIPFQHAYNEFEAMIKEIFDQITVTDGEGNFLKISKPAEKIFGISEKDMLGINARKLESEGIFDKSITVRVLESRQQSSLIQTTAASKRLVVVGFPIFDERGKLYRIVNFSRDVTNTKAFSNYVQATKELFHWLQEEYIEKKAEENMFILTNSAKMARVIKLIKQIARTDATVLLLGETGVGKSLLAKIIHELSPRKEHAFIRVNCGAIPETLLESELFGYEEGSFTGASKSGKKGLLEVANGGTILFDEIAEMPLHLQVKLLNVIHEKEFYRIGGLTAIRTNIRFIAASNKDLKDMVKKGKFREDLYYRLSVIPIEIPPLRERKEDIPTITKHLMSKYIRKYGIEKEISADAVELLKKYSWPGNIRELENLIERLIITSENPVIETGDLVDLLSPCEGILGYDEIIPLKKAKELVEAEMLMKAYKQYKTTRKIAEVLEVDQSTVAKKIKKIKDLNLY